MSQCSLLQPLKGYVRERVARLYPPLLLASTGIRNHQKKVALDLRACTGNGSRKEIPVMEKKGPTPEEHKRALIKDRCARIEKLLASVAKIGTPVSPYLHDIGAIRRKATQELSHIKLAELDGHLAMLFSKLKSVHAADREAIISPRRYELFFSSRGS